MNDNEFTTSTNSSAKSGAVRSPYNRLVRQSKKLGRVAMHTFRSVKNILNKEVPMPKIEQLMGGLPYSNHLGDVKKQKELRDAASLKQIVKRSHQVLARARAVLLTIFPDSVIVDRTKITIIKRNFFWNSDVISFQIEDVLNVSCTTGPFFGSLTIASRVMSTVDHFHIDYLWRNDAIFMKHLIEGHIIAKNNKLETDKLTREELVEMLCELGADAAA